MNTYVLRFTTKGIKNIDKLTSVDFYNNSISKGKAINLDKKNVKGIFGINGGGESAYMLAMDIYNTMTIKSNYLYISETVKKYYNVLGYKLTPIYLDGKGSYNKKKKKEEFNKNIDKYDGPTHVLMCYDIDNQSKQSNSLNPLIEK